jgi:hypothetical protein
MRILSVLLISLVVPCAANDSFFGPPKASEFVLDGPGLMREFNQLAKGPKKCSHEGYRRMEQIMTEVYVWESFTQNLDRLNMLNSFNTTMGGEGEKEIYFQRDEDMVKEEPTLQEAIAALNDWFYRECTVIGKTKEFFNDVKEKIKVRIQKP